ncbi:MULTISPECIES: hypothetical protein [unclassified Xanthobacter]|uniref:hypothetical protein n=1 Tax=unclassified Xanthobacter TaxID=2623496 RepID=UPI001EE11AA4|nr:MULTISPECIES: hypothetical protein [unclassified Xanthobacter]
MGVFEVGGEAFEEQSSAQVPWQAVPIGANSMVNPVTLTSFVQQQGVWCFGPEIPAECRTLDRDFLRQDPITGARRRVNLRRQEFVVQLADAKRHDLKRGHTLVVANLPPAQRRFQTAAVQGYAEAIEDFVFEALALPPLPASAAARAALSDVEAVHGLHRLVTNLFMSERALSACVASHESGAFWDYDDADGDAFLEAEERAAQRAAAAGRRAPKSGAPKPGARQRRDGHYAMAVVADVPRLRADLYTAPAVAQAFEALGDGRYQLRIPGTTESIRVPLEVASRATDHIELAIYQAMAGAGRQVDARLGKPVTRYVLDLFNTHLLAAVHRFDDRLIPDWLKVEIDEERDTLLAAPEATEEEGLAG